MSVWTVRVIHSKNVKNAVTIVATDGSRVQRIEATLKDVDTFDPERAWQRTIREGRSAAARSIRERSR